MERKNSYVDDDDGGEELSTNQIKLKAQEIAKRFEKYQGKYHTSSSRCNTPLPITSAESLESIHSNSVISDSSEKVLLFRQFLENDRKLVENSKIDEQNYSSDDHVHVDKLQNVQSEKENINTKYYEDIIETQLQEKNISSLKNQVVELNKKLENCHNIINEKDILLQSKIDKIESLNKAIVQKNKLNSDTLESLKKRNIEVINEERLRCTQKINQIAKESADLRNEFEDLHRLYDKLKKNSIKIEKENTELRQKEASLESEINQLNIREYMYENEKKSILQNHIDSSQRMIDDMGNELRNLQEENESLLKQIAMLENQTVNNQEKDSLLTEINKKEAEIQHLNSENERLNKDIQNQIIEAQQTANRWTQLKDAYLNDKERMTLLENVIDELKNNNDELNNANLKLTEKVEESMEKIADLTTENSTLEGRNNSLMTVVENMRETYEKALKESAAEYEKEKKQLIEQHENDKNLLKTWNDQIKENTLKLNEVTYQLDVVMKENDSYKCERLELNNCLNNNNTKILELNNIINELNNQIIQMNNELEFFKNENVKLSNKVNGTVMETEENKLLADRFQKQKQLLKVKIRALKESESNCLALQQQVETLTKDLYVLNQKSEQVIQNNKQVDSVVQHCDEELQKCYELLNQMIAKSNFQNQSINKLCCVLNSVALLFSFDDKSTQLDNELLNTVDSICNIVPGNNELQICLKKIVLGSINVLEYIINLINIHRHSKAQLIARSEVDKLISDAVEKVKMSSQNEYHTKNNQLLDLIENLQNDNRTLKLNISSRSLENKEVLTDFNGSMVENLLSVENLNIKTIKDENDTIKQFLKNILEKLGLINIYETIDIQLQNSLNELELIIQEIKSENIQLKKQYHEIQKSISMKTLEQPIEKQIDQSLNNQTPFIQTENVEKSVGIEKLSLSTEDTNIEHIPNTNMTNSTIDSVPSNDDSKSLLLRYKNLKSRFKEVRAKTVDLDKKIISLTNDLECANAKYKQLNDQFVDSNEIHETDIAQCQSEIENLMCEKLEAYRQLTTLKEKHEILQNDYDQLKSNLNENNSTSGNETTSNVNEQNVVLKRKLNETQHLIDSAYYKVLCEWPTIDTNSDWVVVQSKKLDEIVNAKCVSSYSIEKDLDGFDLKESEFNRLQTCVQIIRELVNSILTNKCTIEVSLTNVLSFQLIDLMSDLKSLTETFLEFMSVQNNELHLVDEHHIELSNLTDNHDSNTHLPLKSVSTELPSVVPLTEELTKSTSEKEENEHFQRAIAERDRLIEFLTEKISKLDNLNRNVEDIRLVRDKLDRALTAVHERDVRCDELTLELTRLLEERDMLQLKLSNSIRKIQFLSDNSQIDTSNLQTIDDKLEELHTLEYRRDADLFTNQEQRHKSQMKLHQNHNDNSITQETKPSNIAEEASSSLSWIKDMLW